MSYTAATDGYLQVLVANESDQAVWFDNVEIEVQPALVTQETHYDPWGLELAGIERRGSPEHAYKFQGKELVGDLSLYWMDFGARHYDAQLGRWHVPDPADQFASGYLAMGNNPMLAVDPDGRWVHIVVGAVIGGAINLGLKAYQGKIGSVKDSLVAFGIGAAAGAVTAATGGAVAGAYNLSMTTMAGGLVAGASGAVLGSPIQGIGNAAYFGDAYGPKQFLTDVVVGGVVGGIAGGVAGWLKNVKAVKAGGQPGDIWGFKPGGPTVIFEDLVPTGAQSPDGEELTKFAGYEFGKANPVPSGGNAAGGGFTVNPSKFDYFFGRVVSGAEHNVARSAQNLKDLTTLGIRDNSQLMGVFNQALESGTVISTKTTQYGVTVVRGVNIGNQGSINVGFFYQSGNLSATPSVTTIIPKIFK